MNWVDAVILLGLAAGGFTGWRMGLIGGIASILGIVLGVLVSGKYHSGLAGKLESLQTETVDGSTIVAFVILYLVVFIAVHFAGMIVRGVFRAVTPPMVDGLAGTGLGVVGAGFMLGALCILFGNFAGGGFQKDIQDSSMARFLVDKVPVVVSLLPDKFQELAVLRKLR
ncbi:MAG: CvpA family protein [Chloroflexi bacterium]|nr:CvpA family protein [Chloroflexota bacterium]